MSISSSLVIYFCCLGWLRMKFFVITCSGCVWVWERLLNKLLANDCLMLTDLGFLITASPLFKFLSVAIKKIYSHSRGFFRTSFNIASWLPWIG